MNVFDIIGPVMIGPSSSHTAGALRLGRIAYKILGEEPAKIKIGLSGSFASTGRGHGTDKALLGGCMGMHSDNENIRHSYEIAEKKGIEYSFSNITIPDSHPNTAKIELTGVNGKKCFITGSSVGAGNVIITNVNGMNVSFNGQNDTYIILHRDQTGVIASVTNFMLYSNINISNFSLSREKKGGTALMTIEVDGTAPKELVNTISLLPNVENVTLIRKL